MPVPTLFKWSPRPGPDQTPNSDASDESPATQSPSRFGALHSNVRSMVAGSSIYSRSPNMGGDAGSPKTPFMGFFRRDRDRDATMPAPIDVHAANDARGSNDSRSPLHPPHTAGSYMRAIAPLQDPQEPQTVYRRNSDVPNRHPADVRLDHAPGSVDPETEVLSDEVNQRRRRRRRHRRRKHHRRNANGEWVRRRGAKRACMPFVRGTAARGKLYSSAISGLFLATVLSICTSSHVSFISPDDH